MIIKSASQKSKTFDDQRFLLTKPDKNVFIRDFCTIEYVFMVDTAFKFIRNRKNRFSINPIVINQ